MARSRFLMHYMTAALLRFKTIFHLLFFLKNEDFVKVLHSSSWTKKIAKKFVPNFSWTIFILTILESL